MEERSNQSTAAAEKVQQQRIPSSTNVQQLVARFNQGTNLNQATNFPQSNTQGATTSAPARTASGRVRQLTGAYEAQLRALLRHLQEERARIAALRDQARARRASKRAQINTNDEYENRDSNTVVGRGHAGGEQGEVMSPSSMSDSSVDDDDAEDAALAAALEDIERMLAAHYTPQTQHHPGATPRRSTASHDSTCSGGPGTPDRPLERALAPQQGATTPLLEQHGNDTVNTLHHATDDALYVATEQRVQNLLELFRARHAAAAAEAQRAAQQWRAGPQVLEKRPSLFDPLSANSMYADPLRQVAFPLVAMAGTSDDEED